jgi:competence protein ComEA
MEKEGLIQIDLNSADIEQLVAIPGISENMAERIIARRPFLNLEELLQVKGLGDRTLERIQPFLMIDNLEAEASGSDEKASTIGVEDVVEPRQSLAERFDTFTRTSMERFRISSQVMAFVLLTAVVSVALSVIFSLTILAGINRTLIFGRHAAVREMRSEISQMDTQLKALASDLTSVDQRLQAVEGLSGRMATLEAEFDLINEDVDQAVAIVNQLTGEVDSIAVEVDGMVEKVDIFDEFLKGLQALVSGIFEPIESTQSP